MFFFKEKLTKGNDRNYLDKSIFSPLNYKQKKKRKTKDAKNLTVKQSKAKEKERKESIFKMEKMF